MKKPKLKTVTGRPSKYKPEFCAQVASHMKQGLSFESFAAVIGVNQDTLHEWAKVQPEFSEAKKEAYSHSLLFYERMGVAIMAGKMPKANVAAWIFNMKNRFKWRDLHAIEDVNETREYERALQEALTEMKKERK